MFGGIPWSTALNVFSSLLGDCPVIDDSWGADLDAISFGNAMFDTDQHLLNKFSFVLQPVLVLFFSFSWESQLNFAHRSLLRCFSFPAPFLFVFPCFLSVPLPRGCSYSWQWCGPIFELSGLVCCIFLMGHCALHILGLQEALYWSRIGHARISVVSWGFMADGDWADGDPSVFCLMNHCRNRSSSSSP